MNMPGDRAGGGADLRGAVALAGHFLRATLRAGDRAVDATCGNGNDTLLLAELVGASGQVWALDIQEAALRATAALLEEHGCRKQVELVACGHELLAERVPGPVRAVAFNLGYLPGGDRNCITRPGTTVAALEQAAGLLSPGGVVTVCLYPGHDGGADETAAVERWGAGLDPRTFNVWRHRQLNRSAAAPWLLLMEKRNR